jgi:Fe2+ transport system protein B
MTEITLNPDQLKEILKSAIVELIRDNREEVSELLTEIIEDVAMERAIAEGETTELVSRDSIFQLLEPKAGGSRKSFEKDLSKI